MVSEFGSALNERSELDCFTSITDYFTSSGLANDGRHAPIQSWFYWCAAPSVLLVHLCLGSAPSVLSIYLLNMSSGSLDTKDLPSNSGALC